MDLLLKLGLGGSLLLASGASVLVAEARDPKKKEATEKEITVRGGVAPKRINLWDRTYLGRVERDEKGRLVAQNMTIVLGRPPFGLSVRLDYPPLVKGELVPLFGFLYRVATLSFPDGGKKGQHFAVLQWVQDQDLPEGIRLDPESLTIPLRRQNSGGMARLDTELDLFLDEIDMPKGAEKLPVAALRLRPVGDSRLISSAKVRAGDILVIGDVGHKVSKVVPENSKTGVIGWIELHPTVISSEELKKSAKVVRPVPIKSDKK